MLSLFNITFVAELIALAASILMLDKRAEIWKLFPIFLLIVILAEVQGWYMHYYLHSDNNWIFNILLLISTPFYLIIFITSTEMQQLKKPVIYMAFLFVFFSLGNLLFFEGLTSYNLYTEVFGDFLLVLLCCYFLYAVLINDQPYELFKYEFFWYAIGTLFYCLGNIVLYSFLDVLRRYYHATHIDMYFYINGGLNAVFSACLVIAFICKRKTFKSLPEL